MKFSVCIDAVFAGKDIAVSMESIKKLGYSAYEFWGWWDKDIERVKAAQNEFSLTPATFCTKMVSLVDASQRGDYLTGLEESIVVASELGCKSLITQVGNDMASLTREDQRKNLVEGLRACIPLLEKSGITLTFEPLNLFDHSGYYLYSSKEAFSIAEEIGHPSVKVLYDIYHQQIMEGNIIRQLTENIKWVGHIHAAGNPGRHELDNGELHYPAIFSALEKAGYDGYIGLEYFPAEDAEAGLRKLLTQMV